MGLDSTYVVSGDVACTNPFENRYTAGKYGDLWNEYMRLAHPVPFLAEATQALARKVKAHNELAYLLGEICPIDFLGNLIADVAAGWAADSSVERLRLEAADTWTRRAYLIAMRLSLIESECWEAQPKLVPQPNIKPLPIPTTVAQATAKLLESVGKSKHLMVVKWHNKQRTRGRVTCTRCRSTRSASTDPSF